MGINKEVVYTKVANIVGVPLARPPVPHPPVTPVPKERLWYFDDKSLICRQRNFRGAHMYKGLQTFKSEEMCKRALEKILPSVPPVPAPPVKEALLPEVENIRITSRGPDSVYLEWDKVHEEGVAYKVWVDGIAKGAALTEPWIDLTGLRPRRRYKVEIRTQPYSKMDRRAPSRKVTYYFTTIGDIGVVNVPGLPPEERISGPPVGVPGVTYLAGTKGIAGPLVGAPGVTYLAGTKGISGPRKRKLPARIEELMKKEEFPKAVKEAIEKGLERKEAPWNIERIIEKVAKTNEPNYILKRTIARRIARGDIVQYKVDTDKGTIIYVNADENTANAILGMPTPTGEVIPLQIKVIR